MAFDNFQMLKSVWFKRKECQNAMTVTVNLEVTVSKLAAHTLLGWPKL